MARRKRVAALEDERQPSSRSIAQRMLLEEVAADSSAFQRHEQRLANGVDYERSVEQALREVGKHEQSNS